MEAKKAIAVTAVAAGAGVVTYFLLSQGTVAYAARRPIRPGGPLTDEEIERWITRDGKEVRFADNQTGMPPARQWTHRPYRFAIPTTAKEVPVAAPRRTPIVPEGFNRMTGERVRYLNAVRGILQRAGLGSYDPRILMILWANESAWDRASWGNNLGNVKSQGTLYCQDYPTLLRTRKVWTTVPESEGVQVFIDGLNSIDGYHTFSDPSVYARYCNRVAVVAPLYAGRSVTVNGVTYRGAADALTRGDIGGCEAFARIISPPTRGALGYSPEGPDERARMFVGAWRNSARLCGAGWIR